MKPVTCHRHGWNGEGDCSSCYREKEKLSAERREFIDRCVFQNLFNGTPAEIMNRAEAAWEERQRRSFGG